MRRLSRQAIPIAVAVLFVMPAVAPEEADGPIFINEIAWAGASWDHTAEWIELYNASSEPIDLHGWRLVSSDGAPDIALRGTISPRAGDDPSNGFFLLARSREAVPGVAVDQFYSGALTDLGETLFLYDPQGALVDSANARFSPAGPWPAGTDVRGIPPWASMERLDPRLPDAAAAWATSTAESLAESTRRAIRGTPRFENSVFNVPPTPSFGFSPTLPAPEEPVTFDASASFDENNRIVSWLWDFGDGEAASGPIVTHGFAHEGEYRVTLTVIDAKGSQTDLCRVVRARIPFAPVADFSLVVPTPDQIPRAGDPLRFQDESSDADGPIISWVWDLGDGTAASASIVSHTYEAAGSYTVSLRVAGPSGETSIQTDSVTIASRRPVASFICRAESPTAGEPVQLDASASHDPDGTVTSYHWELAEKDAPGRITADPVIDYVFPEGGEQLVRLSVVDDSGERSLPFLHALYVNWPPIAAFRLSAFEADELEPIRFVDASCDRDGAIVDRLWDFGDGTASEEAQPEHAFRRSGQFAVSLTVTDDQGAQHTAAADVTIRNLPPAARLAGDAARPTGEAFRFDAAESADPSPDGSIASFEWDLYGDGTFDRTTTCAALSHAYDKAGAFLIRVRVTDNDGATATSAPLSIVVTNRPPQVGRVRWEPSTPTDAEDVRFIAEVADPDGLVTAWYWEFGQGPPVTDPSPIIRLPEDGTHRVSLTVEDDEGARSDPFSILVTIENAAPVARFSSGDVGARCIRFDAIESHDPSPSGAIVHVAWDFGDGAACPGTPGSCGEDRWAPLHCYAEPGTYRVTLVVIDDQGALSRTTQTILVPD